MSRYNNKILDSIGTEVSYSAVSDMSESKNFLKKTIAKPILQNMPDFQSGGFMNFLFGPNEPGINDNASSTRSSRNMRNIPGPGELMEALKNAWNDNYARFNQIANETPTENIDINYTNVDKENILHVLVDGIADLENKIQGEERSRHSDYITLQNMKNMLGGLIDRNRDALNAPDKDGSTPFLRAVQKAKHTPAMSQIVGYMKKMGANITGVHRGKPYTIYTDYDDTSQHLPSGIFSTFKKIPIQIVPSDNNQKPIFTPQQSVGSVASTLDTDRFVKNWGARPSNYTETVQNLRTEAQNTMKRVKSAATDMSDYNVHSNLDFNPNPNFKIRSEQLLKEATEEAELIQKEADSKIKQIREDTESKKRDVLNRYHRMSEEAEKQRSAFENKGRGYMEDLRERIPSSITPTLSNASVDDSAVVHALVTKIVGEQQQQQLSNAAAPSDGSFKGGRGNNKRKTTKTVSKAMGTRKMIAFSELSEGNDMFGGDSDMNRTDNRNDNAMKNISRAAANQKDKLHTEAVEKILSHLTKKDDVLAKAVKALIYDEIKQAKPELSGLDKAAEMMKAISKKKVDEMLKKTDLIELVSKKIKEHNERNKSKGDVDSDAVAKITKKVANKESGKSKYDDEFESSVSITSDYESSSDSENSDSFSFSSSPELYKKKKGKGTKRR